MIKNFWSLGCGFYIQFTPNNVSNEAGVAVISFPYGDRDYYGKWSFNASWSDCETFGKTLQDTNNHIFQLQAKLDKAVAEVVNLLNCYNDTEIGRDVRIQARATLDEINNESKTDE